MIKGIIFVLVCLFLGSCFSSENTGAKATDVKPTRKITKKELKRQQKELRRKEEEAYEDMLMYVEIEMFR